MGSLFVSKSGGVSKSFKFIIQAMHCGVELCGVVLYRHACGEWRLGQKLSAFECSAPSYGEEDDPSRKAQGDGAHVPACRWAPLLTKRCYIYYYKYDSKVLEKGFYRKIGLQCNTYCKGFPLSVWLQERKKVPMAYSSGNRGTVLMLYWFQERLASKIQYGPPFF